MGVTFMGFQSKLLIEPQQQHRQTERKAQNKFRCNESKMSVKVGLEGTQDREEWHR
jgi:hypothetical protein